MKLIYKIKKEQLLRDFLKENDISDKLLCDIKSSGDLLVNKNHVTVRYVLQENDELEIVFPQEIRGKQLTPFEYDLDIVYEDEYLFVINKPAKMPCIPDHRYHDQTLANALVAYYDKINLDSTIHFVNRLDKDTSGLLIVAKYRYIHYLLSKSHITRYYHALVEGNIKDITINLPIERLNKSVKRSIGKTGKSSVTHCSLVEKIGDFSLVQCILETGRTHQIRVHLSSIGHPLVGDTLYGSKYLQDYYLNSFYLEFIHPITRKILKFNINEKNMAIKS